MDADQTAEVIESPAPPPPLPHALVALAGILALVVGGWTVHHETAGPPGPRPAVTRTRTTVTPASSRPPTASRYGPADARRAEREHAAHEHSERSTPHEPGPPPPPAP
jgi:hypothetical protein